MGTKKRKQTPVQKPRPGRKTLLIRQLFSFCSDNSLSFCSAPDIFFGGQYCPVCEKIVEPIASTGKKVWVVYCFVDKTAGARRKAALARLHSKTCRHLGRAW
jgi:hypothetical protein